MISSHTQAIKAETDGLREELEIVRTLGADLIFACGETEKPEVKKTIDEVSVTSHGGNTLFIIIIKKIFGQLVLFAIQMNAAWEGLNRTWRERMERLEEAMTASVQYQDALQVSIALLIPQNQSQLYVHNSFFHAFSGHV